MYDQTHFGYAWTNWYFTALAFALASFFILVQTVSLMSMVRGIGEGNIRFRVSEFGNPLTPELIADPNTSLDD